MTAPWQLAADPQRQITACRALLGYLACRSPYAMTAVLAEAAATPGLGADVCDLAAHYETVARRTAAALDRAVHGLATGVNGMIP